jgi:dTDP-4-amino-4,6-dideoxygalactose transaminase
MSIPLFKINQTLKDISRVSKVIKSGRQWAAGPMSTVFESAIANTAKTKYAVVCNSGTSALHATMIALGITEGDEVIVPSFTFISTANAPLYVGATPVFADIEEETFGIDPKIVLNLITSRTKAIIAVHYGGNPCKIKELKKIAADHGLFLIEDCAESMGADCGTYGDASIWSFCQNKIITTGDGGAITTNNKAIYDKLKLIVNLGKDGNDFSDLGYNWRLSEAQCALGLSQLSRIKNIIKKRKANAKYLASKLKVPYLRDSVYQLFTIRKTAKEISKIKKNLKGVDWKVYFKPVHLTKYYKRLGYADWPLPVTEKVSNEVITLPMFPDLTRKEMDTIARNTWTALS